MAKYKDWETWWWGGGGEGRRNKKHVVLGQVMKLHSKDNHGKVIRKELWYFTTRPPAVPDVLVSGRNVGALRPARRVGFRSLVLGQADDICRGHIIFVTPTALKLLKLAPHSKRTKCTLDHCA